MPLSKKVIKVRKWNLEKTVKVQTDNRIEGIKIYIGKRRDYLCNNIDKSSEVFNKGYIYI